MRVLEKSRRRPKPGDFFTYLMTDGLFRFGRVIRTDAEVGGLPCILIYLYRPIATSAAEVPRLRPDDLLLPPIGTNAQPWLRGYFQWIKSAPLAPEDVLARHCFYDDLRGRYYNECGRRLRGRIEPCGDCSLYGYRGIDNDVSEALGIPLSTQPYGPDPGAKKGPKRRGVPHYLEVYINCRRDLAARKKLNDWVYNLEDQLTEAVTQAKVGEVDGHMMALDSSEGTIDLYGKSADKLAKVVLPILRAAKLPKGSYILKRYGDPGDAEERVEL